MTINDTVAKQIEAFNRHDAEGFAACYSANAQVFDPQYPELLNGPAAIKKDIGEFFTAFPDVKATVRQTVQNGGTCAYEISFAGTHKGPMVGPTGHIPATNRRIEIGGGVIARLDGEGRIVDERRYYDLAGLMGQLGLMQ